MRWGRKDWAKPNQNQLNLLKKKLLYFEWSPPWHVGWGLSGEGCYLLLYLQNWHCLHTFAIRSLALTLTPIPWNAWQPGPWNRPSFRLTYLLTFFLAYLLTFFLTFCLTFFLAYLLTFFLTFCLTFFLAFFLTSPDILSDILSDISFALVSDIPFDILSDILSDMSFAIVSDISPDILSDILSDTILEVRHATLNSQDRGWGPARHTELTGSRLGSGTPHWTHRIAVEVRHGTLNSHDRGWDPARNTELTGSRLRLNSQDRGWGPARNTELTGSRLRSGAEHWTHRIAVEVRRGTLNLPGHGTLSSHDRGWGPAQNTELTGSRLRSGAEHWTRMIAVEVRHRTLPDLPIDPCFIRPLFDKGLFF